jgi:hypothetical protein
MQTIKAIYKDGKIELLESFGDIKSADLYIVVVPHREEKKNYGISGEVFQSKVMESEAEFKKAGLAHFFDTTDDSDVDWEDASGPNEANNSGKECPSLIKQTVRMDASRHIYMKIPPSFGDQVEVIILPASGRENKSCFFECVDKEGVEYKLNDWTDKEFNRQSMKGACGDDDTDGKDVFDV